MCILQVRALRMILGGENLASVSENPQRFWLYGHIVLCLSLGICKEKVECAQNRETLT